MPLRTAHRYVDFMRYPFAAEDGPLDEIVHAAARSEAPIADWKRRFIGAPLDELRLRRPRRAPRAEPGAAARRPSTRPAASPSSASSRRRSSAPSCSRPTPRAIGPEDDATLILWGPGLDDGTLLARTQQAVAAAGLDENRLPDILLLPLAGSAAADAALAGRAQALLSEWPPAGRLGALPRLGAGDEAALAARAAAAAPLAA